MCIYIYKSYIYIYIYMYNMYIYIYTLVTSYCTIRSWILYLVLGDVHHFIFTRLFYTPLVCWAPSMGWMIDDKQSLR